MLSAWLHRRAPVPAAIVTLAITLMVAACSKGEPDGSKPRPNMPFQAPTPAEPPKSAGETSEGLRERLARQEAASKMFDKPAAVPEPPKPAPPKVEAKAPEPARATPKPEPARIAPPKAEPPPKVEPPKPEPAKAEPPKPEPPKAEPAKPEPAKAEPPKAAPAKVEAKAPPPVTRIVTRVDPEFPREAVQAGAFGGNVKARLTLDAAGNVTQVDVTEAVPRRIFDRAVIRALTQWKYNEGTAGRLVDVEIEFKR